MIRIPGGSGGVIKQFDVDPSYPVINKTKVRAKDLWVLYTPGGAGATTKGCPIGLLMALTYAETTAGGGAATYQLSGNTTGGIKRFTL
jgi:hypothetical protein